MDERLETSYKQYDRHFCWALQLCWLPCTGQKLCSAQLHQLLKRITMPNRGNTVMFRYFKGIQEMELPDILISDTKEAYHETDGWTFWTFVDGKGG